MPNSVPSAPLHPMWLFIRIVPWSWYLQTFCIMIKKITVIKDLDFYHPADDADPNDASSFSPFEGSNFTEASPLFPKKMMITSTISHTPSTILIHLIMIHLMTPINKLSLYNSNHHLDPQPRRKAIKLQALPFSLGNHCHPSPSKNNLQEPRWISQKTGQKTQDDSTWNEFGNLPNQTKIQTVNG